MLSHAGGSVTFKWKSAKTLKLASLSIGLRVAISLFLISFLHRMLGANSLRVAQVASLGDRILELIVGVWGDLWMSTVLAAPIFLFEMFSKKTRAIRITAVLWLALWTIFTATHQGYVEFFRQQIIPFHLSYLFDSSFLAANNKTLVTFRPSLILFLGAFCCFGLIVAKNKSRTKRRAAVQFFLIVIIATIAHVENIKWRVQWFVPEALQTHYVERLFANLKSKHAPDKLTDEQKSILTSKSGGSSTSAGDTLRIAASKIVDSEALNNYQAKFAEISAQGHSPMIAVVVAESFRPADSGWTRDSSDPISLTPTTDALINKGVLFTNAYSTGPVTRGGQEAVWCGTPTATDTSLMRSFPLFKLSCIPDRAQGLPNAETYWMHAGDSRFDSQLEFWLQHHVTHALKHDDFAKNTPATGWGMSDIALFAKAGEILSNSGAPSKKILMPMILSVTNHIPWDLPSDAPGAIKKLEASHESHRTTAYFDFALGQFVDSLKRNGQWQNTVLIVVSDHGVLEQVRNPSYKKDDPLKWESLASHINLVFSGGITEELVDQNKLPNRVDLFASQAQVAPTIAKIAGLATSDFLDTPLFAGPSPWPVASDLNQYLFLPGEHQKIAKEVVLSGDLNDLNDNARLAVLRYRAFLQMLYEFRP